MRLFLIKSIILVVTILAIHFGLAQFVDGFTDPYYKKVSSPKQDALIIGASRASEGIIPSVIDSVLTIHQQQKGFFNFAFTDSDSPYGKVYLNAIKHKVNLKVKNSVFILSVHPWSISNRKSLKNGLREDNLALAKISNFNNEPNYDYLLNAYQYGWGNILLKKFENKAFETLGEREILKNGAWAYVHNDGWLEVKFLNNDSVFFAKKANNKLKQKYEYAFNPERLEYLKLIIDELKEYGRVFLVRLPIDKRMVGIENEIIPNFDEMILKVASDKNIKYLNYSSFSNNYQYSDGSHFTKPSAVKFSIELAKQILNH